MSPKTPKVVEETLSDDDDEKAPTTVPGTNKNKYSLELDGFELDDEPA